MKYLTIITLISLSISSVIAEENKEDPVIKVATQYFNALSQGDVEVADKLVAAPYSLDRKKVLKTLDEVKAVHKKILEDKGKRDVPKNKVTRPEKFKKLDKEEFKNKYEVIRFTIEEGDHEGEKIDIYVIKAGESHKVIGFSD